MPAIAKVTKEMRMCKTAFHAVESLIDAKALQVTVIKGLKQKCKAEQQSGKLNFEREMCL